MNIPYVKEYDENGNVSNPIKGMLNHDFPNRKARRAHMQKTNSTKIARCSMNNNVVIRAFKYLSQPFNNFCKIHLPRRTSNSN